jgi:hypothetical protein
MTKKGRTMTKKKPSDRELVVLFSFFFSSAILQLQQLLPVCHFIISFSFSALTILASLVMCACEHTEIEAFFQLN